MSEQDIPDFLKSNEPVLGSMPHKSFPPVSHSPTPAQLGAAMVAYDCMTGTEPPNMATRFAAMRAALIAANEAG